MTHTALLIVDIQNDYFADGKWPLCNQQQAATEAAKLLALFRKKSLPIFHIQHLNNNPTAAFFSAGSHGADIHPLVTPLANESTIIKSKPNSFADTELTTLLKQQGIKHLVIAGSMSHMCIDATVRAAVDLGFSCQVAHDACATRPLSLNGTSVTAEQVHTAFMASLAFAYADVQPTHSLLSQYRD